MVTLSFSKTYNLFKLHEILRFIKECLLSLEISVTNIHSLDKEVILNVARKDFSMKISLSEGVIGVEGLKIFQGQPKVKVEVVISSNDQKTVIKLIEKFKDCLFRKVAVSKAGG